jgi:hypothetical protein
VSKSVFEAVFRAGSQPGLVNQPQFDAGLVEFVQEDDGVAHAAGQAVQGDGVQTVDAAEVDDFAEFPHGRSVEGCTGVAVVVEPLVGPMKTRFARRPGEVPAGHELDVARTEVVGLLDRLARIDGVADPIVGATRHGLYAPVAIIGIGWCRVPLDSVGLGTTIGPGRT